MRSGPEEQRVHRLERCQHLLRKYRSVIFSDKTKRVKLVGYGPRVYPDEEQPQRELARCVKLIDGNTVTKEYFFISAYFGG